ncbi:MAG: class II fructose-bisphosphate aldolase [Bacteroidales bacterium]
MKLLPMNQLLINARANGYAVGAFEFWSLDSAQAITQAAQKLNMPVILQAGQVEAEHAGGYDKMYKIASSAACDVDIPVALHLDHGVSIEQVKQAIEAGFTSVMIDASHCTFEENVEQTCRVVELARHLGITVESELGVLAGTEGNFSHNESEALQTKPKEAIRFIKETGIDALAVAIGTAHGFYKFKPEINIKRLKEIAEVVKEPLVLHGGSGTPEDKIVEAIESGIAKVNICTEFIAAFGKSYKESQNSKGFRYNVPDFFTKAKQKGYELAFEKIKLFANNKKGLFN